MSTQSEYIETGSYVSPCLCGDDSPWPKAFEVFRALGEVGPNDTICSDLSVMPRNHPFTAAYKVFMGDRIGLALNRIDETIHEFYSSSGGYSFSPEEREGLRKTAIGRENLIKSYHPEYYPEADQRYFTNKYSKMLRMRALSEP